MAYGLYNVKLRFQIITLDHEGVGDWREPKQDHDFQKPKLQNENFVEKLINNINHF